MLLQHAVVAVLVKRCSQELPLVTELLLLEVGLCAVTETIAFLQI